MARKKIYELDAHSSVVDADVLPISLTASGDAEKATALELKTYAITGLATQANVLELDNTDAFTPDADYEPATKKYVDDNGGTPEGTAVLSTGEVGGTKFLREDGDGTCSWQVPAGSGDMTAAVYDAAAITEQLIGLTATQTMTNKTLTAPVVNSPTGIVKGDVGLGNVDNTSDATKNAATVTLTNKRITDRVGTVADAATVTPTGDDSDMYTVTALAQGATIAAPSGTPTNGQRLMLRIKDDGTTRALTWNAIYNVVGVTLPTDTTAGKTHYIGCVYNTANTKWDVLAVGEEA